MTIPKFIPWNIRCFLIRCFLRNNRVQVASMIFVEGKMPDITNLGTLELGLDCHFRSHRLPVSITVCKAGRLEIGDKTFVNDGVNICATKYIKIGRNVKIGDMTYIFDSNFHQSIPEVAVKRSDVTIEDNVWLGAYCVVLPGASIGKHSVIAAGSVVKGMIPDRCIAAGNPAQIIKTFKAADNWVRD